MYGPIIENLLSSLNELQTSSYNSLKTLSTSLGSSRSQMISHWHTWGGTNTGSADGDESHEHTIATANTSNQITSEGGSLQEQSYPISSSSIISGINGSWGKIAPLIQQVRYINSKLYTGTNSFNNSVGSPYAEIYRLETAYGDTLGYSNIHPSLDYISDKIGMFTQILSFISCIPDAKYAVLLYNNNLQQGYDTYYNGGKRSLSTPKFGNPGEIV